MSSGERPIGAAKGKQSDTEALCQPPAPPLPSLGGPDGAEWDIVAGGQDQVPQHRSAGAIWNVVRLA